MKHLNYKQGGASAQANSLQAQITSLLQEAQRDTVEVGARSLNLCDGLRRSIYKGGTGDFLHPTEYDPQEHDARMIMQAATARTGGEVIYVRVHRPETQLPVVLLIDGSRTLMFGSGDESKLWLAAKAAVSLCLSLRDTQDRVLPIVYGGGSTWTTGVPTAPQQAMYQIAARLLEPSFTTEASDLERALNMVPDRQAEVIIISDFLNLTPAAAQTLTRLGRRNSTRALVVHDIRERELPEPAWWWPLPSLLPVFDLETGEEASWWNTAHNRARFAHQFQVRQMALHELFDTSNIRHETIETNQGASGLRKFLRLLALPPIT